MKRHLAVPAFLLLFIGQTAAQGLFESSQSDSINASPAVKAFDLNGYARGMAWGGSQTNYFSNLSGELALKTKLSNGKTFLYGDVRFREGIFFGDRKSVFELKEAYAGYTGTRISVYLGNQIVTWGRTDGFNPTNIITPNDYFNLTPEPDDQKLGNFMLRPKIRLSNEAELEMIVVPVFKPSVYRYDLFDMGGNADFTDILIPEAKAKNATLAARLNVELPAAGFSVSFFHGYDPFYGFKTDTIEFQPSPQVTYNPAVYQKNTIGADFAIPVSQWVFRGEAALNLTKDYLENQQIPNPDLSYVLGIERTIAGYTAIFQYIGKYTFDFTPITEPVLADPENPLAQMQYAIDQINYQTELFNRKIFNQQEETNHALFLSVSKLFAHDVLSAELSGYYNLTSEEYLIRPTLKWNITDALSASFGASIMQGPDMSVFEKAGKVLNGAFVGLTASF
jgi:hypothetical protein